MKRGPETNIENLPEQVKPKRVAPITYDEFFHACKTGNLEEVEEGIKSFSPDDVESNEWDVIEEAAANGHFAVLKLLLEMDMSKEIRISWSAIALIIAAKYGHLAVVNYLLENDAVMKLANVAKNGALRHAADNGHLAVVRRLLEIEAVRESATNSYADGLIMNVLSRLVAWVTGNNQNPIKTLIERLAENHPKLQNTIEEKEKRKNEARALYFAFKAVNRRDEHRNIISLSLQHPHVKSPLRGAQSDVIRMISTIVKNSPPPAEQLEGFRCLCSRK